MHQPCELVSFDRPDEVREGANWRMEIVHLAGGAHVGRMTLQPGWQWTKDVRRTAGTELCMAPHQQYIIQGRLHIAVDEGTDIDARPGDVLSLPPGHDAWVVGDEQVVLVDWEGASIWAKKPEAAAAGRR